MALCVSDEHQTAFYLLVDNREPHPPHPHPCSLSSLSRRPSSSSSLEICMLAFLTASLHSSGLKSSKLLPSRRNSAATDEILALRYLRHPRRGHLA
ncbi:unnamed protein product [Merluccius merluccius]